MTQVYSMIALASGRDLRSLGYRPRPRTNNKSNITAQTQVDLFVMRDNYVHWHVRGMHTFYQCYISSNKKAQLSLR